MGWMTIDQKVAGCRVLVGAHPRFDNRRTGQRGHAAREPGASEMDSRSIWQPIVGLRVDRTAVLVDPDLDAAAVDVRRAVDPRREIDPRRHLPGGKPAVP